MRRAQRAAGGELASLCVFFAFIAVSSLFLFLFLLTTVNYQLSTILKHFIKERFACYDSWREHPKLQKIFCKSSYPLPITKRISKCEETIEGTEDPKEKKSPGIIEQQ